MIRYNDAMFKYNTFPVFQYKIQALYLHFNTACPLKDLR